MVLNQIDSVKLTNQEERMIHTMQLLGDKTRFKLLKLLNSHQEMCVSELASALNISTSAVSQHFRSFELLGLVDKNRHGQKICYQIKTSDPFVLSLLKIINK